jgi:hypothetical protein
MSKRTVNSVGISLYCALIGWLGVALAAALVLFDSRRNSQLDTLAINTCFFAAIVVVPVSVIGIISGLVGIRWGRQRLRSDLAAALNLVPTVLAILTVLLILV